MNRSCDGCTMCCKLLAVTELEKPAGKQCTHCDAGKGCKVYEQRPEACKVFTCFWLQGLTQWDMYPADVRVVVDSNEDGTGIVMHCDPHSDWRSKKPVQEFLHLCLNRNLPVVIVEGERRKFIGAHRTVLPEVRGRENHSRSKGSEGNRTGE